MVELDEYFTAAQAAAELGVTRQAIHNMARRYGWQTIRLGRSLLYQRDEVLATPRDFKTRLSQGQQRRQAARKAISTDIPPGQPAKPKPGGRRKALRRSNS